MDRSELALRLRKEGLTYREIGERLRVSRQRAHQLVARAGEVPVFRKVCERCGAPFTTRLTKAKYCPKCRSGKRTFRCRLCGKECEPDELVKDERGRPTKLCKKCAAKIIRLTRGGDR